MDDCYRRGVLSVIAKEEKDAVRGAAHGPAIQQNADCFGEKIVFGCDRQPRRKLSELGDFLLQSFLPLFGNILACRARKMLPRCAALR